MHSSSVATRATRQVNSGVRPGRHQGTLPRGIAGVATMLAVFAAPGEAEFAVGLQLCNGILDQQCLPRSKAQLDLLHPTHGDNVHRAILPYTGQDPYENKEYLENKVNAFLNGRLVVLEPADRRYPEFLDLLEKNHGILEKDLAIFNRGAQITVGLKGKCDSISKMIDILKLPRDTPLEKLKINVKVITLEGIDSGISSQQINEYICSHLKKFLTSNRSSLEDPEYIIFFLDNILSLQNDLDKDKSKLNLNGLVHGKKTKNMESLKKLIEEFLDSIEVPKYETRTGKKQMLHIFSEFNQPITPFTYNEEILKKLKETVLSLLHNQEL